MIEYINRFHPEINDIWGKLPELTLALRDRLWVRGMKPLPYSDLLRNVQEHIRGHGEDYTLVTAGPCAVGYNYVKPWWSEHSVYIEEFIIRYKPGNFADTIKALEQHAKALGCKDLVISSLAMMRQESYGEYLKRKGFREVTRQYVKGIT